MKIKLFSRFFLFCLAGLHALAMAQPGFVTLDGKQFKLNGANFYPLGCCYSFTLVHDGDYNGPADLYVSPNNGYGPGNTANNFFFPNYDCECSGEQDCLEQMDADFLKISQMGFNMIRTHGVSPLLRDIAFNSDTGQSISSPIFGFYLPMVKNDVPLWVDIEHYPIIPPYNSTNDNFIRFVYLLEKILEKAASNNLKVLLDIGTDDYARKVEYQNDYGNFLKALAARLKDNQALMAYVIFEEPYWSDHGKHTKSEVCQVTGYWYDKIHEEDQNHLITIGGCLEEEAWEWDPAVVKVDFISPHPYPATFEWEGASYAQAYERFLGRLVWLQRNSPVPWILGEMAIGAQDDYYEFDNSQSPAVWTRYALAPPRVHTSDLQVQKQFAASSLADTRDCGGSGYTWWQFQETWWVNGLGFEQNHNHDAMGLLRHAPYQDPASPSNMVPLEKPVVEAFADFITTPPPPQVVQQPQNYHNPFNGNNFMVSGYVKDQDDVPVRDAFIYASNWDWPKDDNITLYGFTDENGYYNIGTPHNYEYSFFNYFKVSAVGCGVSDIPPLNTYISTMDFNISRPLLYNSQINPGTTLQINQDETFQAISAISVGNLTIEGNGSSGVNAEIMARNSVTLQNGFWAKSGSEVHVHAGAFLVPCETWPEVLIESKSSLQSNTANGAREIEICFDVMENEASISIYPNPSGDVFNITLQGVDLPAIVDVSVFDCLGRMIINEKQQAKFSIKLDMKGFLAGSYMMLIKSEKLCFSRKLFKF